MFLAYTRWYKHWTITLIDCLTCAIITLVSLSNSFSIVLYRRISFRTALFRFITKVVVYQVKLDGRPVLVKGCAKDCHNDRFCSARIAQILATFTSRQSTVWVVCCCVFRYAFVIRELFGLNGHLFCEQLPCRLLLKFSNSLSYQSGSFYFWFDHVQKECNSYKIRSGTTAYVSSQFWIFDIFKCFFFFLLFLSIVTRDKILRSILVTSQI